MGAKKLTGQAKAAVREMRTNMEDIVRTNASSTWMAEVEQEPEKVRVLLQAKLAQVPATAAKITGPRDDNDVSFAIWEKVKRKVGVDLEAPLTIS